MLRFKAISSGIIGLLLAASPALATDYTELTLFFASSSAIQSNYMQASTTVPALQDNDVLSPADVFEISSVYDAPQPGGLFRNADLILNIQSAGNDIAHTEVLDHCKSLDLITDSSMFGQHAECDKQSFSYSVDGNMVVVFKNNSVFREYELEAGNYMINGYPVIFN